LSNDDVRIRSASKNGIGAKAIGLLRVPQEWVPPFIVLTSTFFDRASSQTVQIAFDEMSDDERAVEAVGEGTVRSVLA
jgi:hypothetical protein